MEDDFFGNISDSVADVTNSISGSVGSFLEGAGSTIADVAVGALTGAAVGAFNGILGNLTSLDPNLVLTHHRMYGIPPGAEVNYRYNPVSAQFRVDPRQKDWRVSITSPIILESDALLPLVETDGMVFPFLPTVQFISSAQYDPIPTTHNNYPFLAYRSSRVEDISITGSFVVQDQNEGIYWLSVMHFLRTVTKMYFGSGPNLGNPPPICTLNGYGDFVFNNISCVVKQFNINFQKDVDYIAVDYNGLSYVPTRSEISVTVAPVYSRDQLKTFNLSAFASGELISGDTGKGWI
jgi:hypothetical protein